MLTAETFRFDAAFVTTVTKTRTIGHYVFTVILMIRLFEAVFAVAVELGVTAVEAAKHDVSCDDGLLAHGLVLTFFEQ